MTHLGMLESFIEKLKEQKFEFFFSYEKNKYTMNAFFLCRPVGKALYIYGRKMHTTEQEQYAYARIDAYPMLVAIMANDMLYIIDEYMFDLHERSYHNIPLPDNVMLFTEFCKQTSDRINKDVVEKLYNNLIPTIKLTTTLKKDCKNRARKILLSNMKDAFAPPKIEITDKNDFALMLCGFLDLEKKVADIFYANEAIYDNRKSHDTQTKEFVDNPDFIPTWELEIAKAVNQAIEVYQASYITVEFEFNGNIAAEKIEPSVIIRKMIGECRDMFVYYDFQSDKKGKDLFHKLGIGVDEGYHYMSGLKPEHIKTITYRNHILFSR